MLCPLVVGVGLTHTNLSVDLLCYHAKFGGFAELPTDNFAPGRPFPV